MRQTSFHVLTVGWNLDVIERLADPIQAATGFEFSHVLDPALDATMLQENSDRRFFFIREDLRTAMPDADLVFLGELEKPGVPTIHNMIMGDRLVRNLDYKDALDYASYLGRRFEQLFARIKPSVILGGFDGLHSGIALAVARKIEIPWFALSFTSIPVGMTAFCTGMTPETCFSFRPQSPDQLRAIAERTLVDFEKRRLTVPAYLSASSVSTVLQRLPNHFRMFRAAIRRLISGRFDRFTQHPVRHLGREYLRKRVNLLRLPQRSLLQSPPHTPYVFFGFHMQPESSIDVWAPFFADQFAVVEAIARSTPPTHEVLVKLHKSDADNYSRRQLNRLMSLPGVRLASPYADSRDFIEGASLVFAIQGSIAMEAALIGRPVLLFGDSKFALMPSVSKLTRVTDLPAQVRSKLAEGRPDREAIIRGLMSYLTCYAPGCANDWQVDLTTAEVSALADHFRALRDFVMRQQTAQSRATLTVAD